MMMVEGYNSAWAPGLVDEVVPRVLCGPLQLRLKELLPQAQKRPHTADLLPLPAHSAHLLFMK